MAKNNAGQTRAQKDKDMAARLKREKVCRTTGRCSVCYRIILIESWKSRYTHRCWI